jgi:hypothetical protein
LVRERFLERGTEQNIACGTIFSSNDESSAKRVWFVLSGKIVYRIFVDDNLIVEFECYRGSIAGIVEVCAPNIRGGRFEIALLEDSLLYSWNREEFSNALGIFQELATEVIKRLSFILRKVNRLIGSSCDIENTEQKVSDENHWSVSGSDSSPGVVQSEDLEMELMEFAFGEINASSKDIYEKLGISLGDSQIVFAEGSSGHELYIVLSGAIEIVGDFGSDAEIVLAVLDPGEIFGEMSHFDEAPRSATARSRGDTRLLAFSRENFSLIFQLHPKWTKRLIDGLSMRIRRTIGEA